MRDTERRRLLVLETGGHRAGVPLAHVREIMRPLPLERLGGAPHFVLGLSVIRGESVPVVHLGALLGESVGRGESGRFTTLDVEGRAVALAVARVIGVAELDPRTLSSMPPLLGGAAGDVVEALGLHDAALLLVLRAARLVPDNAALGAEAPS